MNIASTLLCHISLSLFPCIILILRCIIKLPKEKYMFAGPSNIKPKDSIPIKYKSYHQCCIKQNSHSSTIKRSKLS